MTRAAPGGAAHRQVGDRVADHGGAPGRDAQHLADREQHRRVRLHADPVVAAGERRDVLADAQGAQRGLGRGSVVRGRHRDRAAAIAQGPEQRRQIRGRDRGRRPDRGRTRPCRPPVSPRRRWGTSDGSRRRPARGSRPWCRSPGACRAGRVRSTGRSRSRRTRRRPPAAAWRRRAGARAPSPSRPTSRGSRSACRPCRRRPGRCRRACRSHLGVEPGDGGRAVARRSQDEAGLLREPDRDELADRRQRQVRLVERVEGDRRARLAGPPRRRRAGAAGGRSSRGS